MGPEMRRLDSHQVLGIGIILSVILGLVGLLFQRFDVVIMLGGAAFLLYAFTGSSGTGPPDGDGGGGGAGSYEPSDCGGDGGGD